ncbi:hypothetical protein QO004_005171 [Rhizobium mesoamericanum]|uniref:hypothetical protein n=1 Tax=Rhizobium mesoamericanum TaxID=1079800 RepID=UPI00277DBF76|nr:hypothetical protein [Rhizobium mesoamericanum]MDQ0563362.1 hypothetical protein [Rhizobium mesoamericanum]
MQAPRAGKKVKAVGTMRSLRESGYGRACEEAASLPDGMRRSLNDVADALAEAGYLSSIGNCFTRAAVSRMFNRKSDGKA